MGLPLRRAPHQQDPSQEGSAGSEGRQLIDSSDLRECRRIRQELGEVAAQIAVWTRVAAERENAKAGCQVTLSQNLHTPRRFSERDRSPVAAVSSASRLRNSPNAPFAPNPLRAGTSRAPERDRSPVAACWTTRGDSDSSEVGCLATCRGPGRPALHWLPLRTGLEGRHHAP